VDTFSPHQFGDMLTGHDQALLVGEGHVHPRLQGRDGRGHAHTAHQGIKTEINIVPASNGQYALQAGENLDAGACQSLLELFSGRPISNGHRFSLKALGLLGQQGGAFPGREGHHLKLTREAGDHLQGLRANGTGGPENT